MKRFLGICVICAIVLFPSASFALDSIEFFTGYLAAELKDGKDYDVVPFTLSLNWNAAPSLDKIGLRNYPGKICWVVEPFVNLLTQYTTNYEAGTNLLVKYSFPLTEKFHPYFKGGAGMIYMGQKVGDQATRFNFIPQGGVGCYYFIKEDLAISMEFKYRHLSNASIKHPNNGIDSIGGLVGVAKFF